MPGNYRYEEERSRGQRGTTRRGGFGGRGREDDDMAQRESEQYDAGSRYGPEWGSAGGSRYRSEPEGREYGSSLGGRDAYEGYEEGESYGAPYSARSREDRYGTRDRYGARTGSSWQGERGAGSPQADGWTAGRDEQFGRQQGFRGSPEYGEYAPYIRSQSEYQSHAGKGPKGWKRSDERIREEVNEALARHPEIDATDIEVRVDNCEVTLTGTVSDRRTKRLAEDVAEQVFGTEDVANQLKVSRNRFGDRDVTASPDRETKSGAEGQETTSASRKTGATAAPGSTPTR